MRKNYNMKKTISIKRFLSELGGDFSEHIKDRLLELELRCVLTRKEKNNVLDLKHVEHTKYPCSSENSSKCEKEYAYAEFIVEDDKLYFADKCLENEKVMESPIVNSIYNSLNTENKIFEDDIIGKELNDSNIDYVVDNLLSVCPNVSKRYLEVLEQMSSY
ncbi:hypothetical protein [Haloimpatiens lingqiaonensis]|uniref:hypothetical protein n=1 Tax=Haloimpatiens lingqiaonensis TaxID=1380675 RepID=UPI0010FDFCD6|nr:hypothetical protein [Haloimpatiens lingqiaonensis]